MLGESHTDRLLLSDGRFQEPDRLDTTLHRLCSSDPGPYPRNRTSERRFAVLQHGQRPANTWSMDAHVRHTEPELHTHGI